MTDKFPFSFDLSTNTDSDRGFSSSVMDLFSRADDPNPVREACPAMSHSSSLKRKVSEEPGSDNVLQQSVTSSCRKKCDSDVSFAQLSNNNGVCDKPDVPPDSQTATSSAPTTSSTSAVAGSNGSNIGGDGEVLRHVNTELATSGTSASTVNSIASCVSLTDILENYLEESKVTMLSWTQVFGKMERTELMNRTRLHELLLQALDYEQKLIKQKEELKQRLGILASLLSTDLSHS